MLSSHQSVHIRAFRTGKIAVLTPHSVPHFRPDYFRFHTQNFESGLTPQIVRTIRPRLGADLTL